MVTVQAFLFTKRQHLVAVLVRKNAGQHVVGGYIWSATPIYTPTVLFRYSVLRVLQIPVQFAVEWANRGPCIVRV